eukprot:CAMPEP_0194323770 /NCGR_PEP_ID=MMETSP0171-20130528/25953_1 /TAXON_ID=218684 /ORGANISM="Corethron pennatum, Strain L29A3" /LENGTH=383 /DNA_ID=CAMNT_0039082493 /DNA_START=40 /DNA_END=1191 /DNA_ORIENTATION=-
MKEGPPEFFVNNYPTLKLQRPCDEETLTPPRSMNYEEGRDNSRRSLNHRDGRNHGRRSQGVQREGIDYPVQDIDDLNGIASRVSSPGGLARVRSLPFHQGGSQQPEFVIPDSTPLRRERGSQQSQQSQGSKMEEILKERWLQAELEKKNLEKRLGDMFEYVQELQHMLEHNRHTDNTSTENVSVDNVSGNDKAVRVALGRGGSSRHRIVLDPTPDTYEDADDRVDAAQEASYTGIEDSDEDTLLEGLGGCSLEQRRQAYLQRRQRVAPHETVRGEGRGGSSRGDSRGERPASPAARTTIPRSVFSVEENGGDTSLLDANGLHVASIEESFATDAGTVEEANGFQMVCPHENVDRILSMLHAQGAENIEVVDIGNKSCHIVANL